MADQTEIDMPMETLVPEDPYENANPQDYGIDYEPEEINYGEREEIIHSIFLRIVETILSEHLFPWVWVAHYSIVVDLNLLQTSLCM